MTLASKCKLKLKIDPERCKACRLCMAYCPKSALKVSESFNSLGIHPMELADEDACGGCAFCAVVCPDAAIQIVEENGE